MKNDEQYPGTTLFTYTGKVAFPSGSPSLLDIAISLSREGRYCGHGLRFWPVALHVFAVSDLLPNELKFDGLNHDDPECIIGDTPKPAKSQSVGKFEEELLSVMYRSFGVTLPTSEEHAAVKQADKAVLRGEVFTVGTQALQETSERHPQAEAIVQHYADLYSYADCLEAGGKVPIEFIRRFRTYKDLLPSYRLLN
jgi:hypothetical protein